MRGRLLPSGYPAMGAVTDHPWLLRSGHEAIMRRTAPAPELLTRELDGVAVPYGIRGVGLQWDVVADLGYFTESFGRGAFADTLLDVRLKIGHDHSRIALAYSPDTLSVTEEDPGLIYLSDLDLRSPEHMTLAVALERRDVRKSSISFSGMSYEFTEGDDDRKPHYHVTHVERLWEISAVDFPAHESSDMRPRDTVPADVLTRTRLYADLVHIPIGAAA